MSDRVAVMRNGRLVQVDTPQTLYARPADHLVASFVGESTLVPVIRRGARRVAVGSAELECPADLPADADLYLAVQAETALIGSTPSRAGYNTLSGTVQDVVFQGERYKLSIALDDGPTISVRQPGHHTAAALLPATGCRVDLSLHVEDTTVVAKPGASRRSA